MKLPSIALIGLFALGCARERGAPPTVPPLTALPPGYDWPPHVISEQPANAPLLARAPAVPAAPVESSEPAAASEPAPPSVPLPAVPVLSATAIPPGDACIARLGQLGIQHRRLESRRGIDTPIVVTGSLGGIEYVAGAGLPFECDCRLAVALHQVGPVLAGLGVSKLRYSGVYTYR
jgi:hypothetical protein